ncbi:unnamed protein product [Brugia pahangi]|uniref:Ovule protein n=1 Tax=Brugia pahangi TaxID=6280 RepID=A0A0N4SY99_BRUPA|nr:unnamed protein product [Brugia pahangi]
MKRLNPRCTADLMAYSEYLHSGKVQQTARQQESTTFMICFLHLHLLSNCYHLTSSAVISDCSEEFKNGNRHEDEEGL